MDDVSFANESFYDVLSGNVFRANAWTAGPWDPGLQHGGPPAALLGRALETQRNSSDARIASIVFDFYGPVPVSEVSIQTEVLRPGTKVQLCSATLHANGRIAMRATAWHVRVETGRSPSVPPPFVAPELPHAESEARFPQMGRFPYGDALEWRFVRGGYDRSGPATVWTRCRIPLVRGEPLTGLDRVLIAVDSANGISAELPFAEWTFVPIDLMVVLTRVPGQEWIGMDARTTMGSDGVGASDALLFDRDGGFGRAVQTLFIARR
jgi:hypothetical protein